MEFEPDAISHTYHLRNAIPVDLNLSLSFLNKLNDSSSSPQQQTTDSRSLHCTFAPAVPSGCYYPSQGSAISEDSQPEFCQPTKWASQEMANALNEKRRKKSCVLSAFRKLRSRQKTSDSNPLTESEEIRNSKHYESGTSSELGNTCTAQHATLNHRTVGSPARARAETKQRAWHSSLLSGMSSNDEAFQVVERASLSMAAVDSDLVAVNPLHFADNQPWDIRISVDDGSGGNSCRRHSSRELPDIQGKILAEKLEEDRPRLSWLLPGICHFADRRKGDVRRAGGSEVSFAAFFMPSMAKGEADTPRRQSFFVPMVRVVGGKKQRRSLNDAFRREHSWLQKTISLSKLRNLKCDMFSLAGRMPDLDPSTIAMAWVYFERLIQCGAVQKHNRKQAAGACLFLAFKFNQALRPTRLPQLAAAIQSLDRMDDLTLHDIFVVEFQTFSILRFDLKLDFVDIRDILDEFFNSRVSAAYTQACFESEYGMNCDTFFATQTKVISPETHNIIDETWIARRSG